MSETQPIRRSALLLTETKPGSDAEAAEMVRLYNLLVGWVRELIPEPTRASPSGYVYFMQAAGGGPIKIGWSKNPTERLSDLSCGAPVRLTLLAAVPAQRHEEGLLHERFADSRIRREWFRASPELLSLIKEASLSKGLRWADAPKSANPHTGKPE